MMIARLAAPLAAAGMAVAPMLPQHGAAAVLMIQLCNGGAPVEIPLDHKPRPQDDGGACHAACLRKHPLDDEGDLDA